MIDSVETLSVLAARFPLEEDLSKVSGLIYQLKIAHKIIEVSHQQEIWVANEEDKEKVNKLIEKWKAGEFRIEVKSRPKENHHHFISIMHLYMSFPVTLVMITVILGCGLITQLGANQSLISQFTFLPLGFFNRVDAIDYFSQTHEYWRVISPILIHFGWLHIVFNLLWFWTLGKLIELKQSSSAFVYLIIFIAIVSNVAQYAAMKVPFGGLSGVVYGLLGYCWLYDIVNKRPVFELPKSLIGVMLFFLALGFTGFFEYIAFASIANMAHLFGLLSGIAFVFLQKAIKELTH